MLDKLFGPNSFGLMQRLGAKVVLADSEAEDYPATNVLDGDGQSIWHTPYSGDNPPGFPHFLVIRFPKPIAMRGVKFLPRQDMRNGRVKEFAIYVGSDGKKWGEPVKKGHFANTGELQTVEFARPMVGRFVKFEAISSFEKKPYASMAEIEVIPAP